MQKLFSQILMKKTQPVKYKTLLAFLLISSFYCYVIKYLTKQKDLLPFHVTNGKLTI